MNETHTDAGGKSRDIYPYPTRTLDVTRKHLTPIVRDAQENSTATVITRYGVPACAIVPLSALAELGWISGGGPVAAQPIIRNGHLAGYMVPATAAQDRAPDLEALEVLLDELERQRAGFTGEDG